MTAVAHRKFMIETVFAPDGTVLREQNGRKIMFTEAEVEAERTAAFSAGRREEHARGEKQIADALNGFTSTARAVLSTFDAEARALREEAAALAMAAAKAVAGAALDQFGEARVRAALEEALDGLRSAPRLVVRLPSDSAERLRLELERVASDQGFSGALVVRPDPAFQAGDLALEWGDGAIRLERAEALARVEEILTRALSQASHGA